MSTFSKKNWTNRVAEYINRRILTYSDGHTDTVTVARSEGTITVEGDAFNQTNMNDLENRIDTAFSDALDDSTITFDGSYFYIHNGTTTKKLGSSEGTATTDQVLVGATFNSVNTPNNVDYSTGTMKNFSGVLQASNNCVFATEKITVNVPTNGYYDTTSKIETVTAVSGSIDTSRRKTFTVTLGFKPRYVVLYNGTNSYSYISDYGQTMQSSAMSASITLTSTGFTYYSGEDNSGTTQYIAFK